MNSNLIAYLLFLILLGGCQQPKSNESNENSRTLSLNINEQAIPLNSSNKVKLSYLMDGHPKPIEVTSNRERIVFPKYDSAMTFFRIEFDTFNLDFSGDFLLYELPEILRPENKNLYLDIDTEPFTSTNIAPTENTEYIIGLYYNEERTNGAWSRKDD